MNLIILFVGIIIPLVVIYIIGQLLQRLYYKFSVTVFNVLAGDEDEHPRHCNRSETLRPFESFRFQGKRIDPKNYIIARVDGECMHPRDIHSGNIVFIHKMTIDEKKDIKDRSILYIKSEKNGVVNYYLREFIKEKSRNNLIATRFYRNGSEPKESEPHHKLEDIIGVVKFCFE